MALPGFATRLGGAAGAIVGMLQFGVNVRNGRAVGSLSDSIGRLRDSFIKFGVTTIFLDRLLQSFSRAWDTLNNTLGVDRMTDRSAQLARMAEGLGTNTERLSAFVGISEKYGAEINDIPDLIATMQDKLKDFAEGNKTVADNFRKTGLLPKDFVGKGPLDRFLILVDGVKRLDEADRAAFLSRTFGDDLGRKFAPMVVKGSKAIRDEMIAMTLTGQVMSASQIKMGAQTRAAMVKAWGVFDGFRNSMSMVFMPTMQKAMASVADFFEQLAITARKHVDEMSSAIERLYNWIKTFGIVKFLGDDINRVFAGLQAVILSVAAASFLWLAGMLAAAAPFIAMAAVLGLVLQDIYVYMQGGDSLIGRILGSGGGLISMFIEGFKAIYGFLNMLYEASKLFLIEVLASPIIPLVLGFIVSAAGLITVVLVVIMTIVMVLIRIVNGFLYGVLGLVEMLLGFLVAIVGIIVQIIELIPFLDTGLGDWIQGTAQTLLGKGYNEFGNVKGALQGGTLASKMGTLYGPTSGNPGTVNNILVNNTVNSVNAPATSMAVLNDSMNRVAQKVSP